MLCSVPHQKADFDADIGSGTAAECLQMCLLMLSRCEGLVTIIQIAALIRERSRRESEDWILLLDVSQ